MATPVGGVNRRKLVEVAGLGMEGRQRRSVAHRVLLLLLRRVIVVLILLHLMVGVLVVVLV